MWRMTPKKLMKLWEQHKVFNGIGESKEKEKDIYIDEIGFL